MFVVGPVTIASELGPLELGIVDVHAPGVADGVSRLLMRSIQDARAEVGGHLPSWLVDDIERNYISSLKVRTLWAEAGHRFALRLGDEIIGTIHIARSHRTILTVDRHLINVDEQDHPGFKPPRHHHVVNISVRHELRRAHLGTRMLEGIVTHFRHLFDGDGLWVRADPPWHGWLSGLGFVHDPALDVFLPPSVERTAGLPHPDFNRRYACACAPARPELATHKLQYVSMTRSFEAAVHSTHMSHAPMLEHRSLGDFGPRTADVDVATPASVEELAAVMLWASRSRRRTGIRGQGQSYDGASFDGDVVVDTSALDRVVAADEERVTVEGGATWRALLTALAPAGRFPPVVPSWVESSIGGTLADGGIGRGSARNGWVIDHVESLVVVTGDGRRIECSLRQAGWLFEAVLGGRGRFGVIASATLRLVPWPRFIETRAAIVDVDALADALADRDAVAASAVAGGRAFRVFRSYPTDAGSPTVELLCPQRRDVPNRPRAYVRTRTLRDGLRAAIEHARAHRSADETLRVHPVRVDDADAFVVAVDSPARGREGGREERAAGPSGDAHVRAAKALADPEAILPGIDA